MSVRRRPTGPRPGCTRANGGTGRLVEWPIPDDFKSSPSGRRLAIASIHHKQSVRTLDGPKPRASTTSMLMQYPAARLGKRGTEGGGRAAAGVHQLYVLCRREIAKPGEMWWRERSLPTEDQDRAGHAAAARARCGATPYRTHPPRHHRQLHTPRPPPRHPSVHSTCTRGRGQLRSDLAGRLWDYPSLCTHVAGDRHAHGVAPTSAAKKDALHLGE